MSKIGAFLAILAPMAVVVCTVLLLLGCVPEGVDRDLLNLLLGCLVMLAKDVYGFEFGSSRGSREKDKVARQQPRQPDE